MSHAPSEIIHLILLLMKHFLMLSMFKTIAQLYILCKLVKHLHSKVYDKGHCTLSPKCSYAFFSYWSSLPIKMLATDAKTQKIEPDLNCFYWQMKVLEAVCKRDWQREVVFIFCVNILDENFGLFKALKHRTITIKITILASTPADNIVYI